MQHPDRKNFAIGGIVVLTSFVLVSGLLIYYLTLPTYSGVKSVAGLRKPVNVEFDVFANPAIHAQSRLDAYFVLGYLTARERLFQMDLLRRKAAGRLSEIFGHIALKSDVKQRHFGFSVAVANLLPVLPDTQRQILQAYADGINAHLNNLAIMPVEFLLQGYTPEPWRMEDSLLISLSMFQLLNKNSRTERMLTVMDQALPADVVAFLTPQDDQYNPSVLLRGQENYDSSAARIPVHSIRQMTAVQNVKAETGLVETDYTLPGSNQWAVRIQAGKQALLANDMHLPLGVPGLWYQARLHYPAGFLTGITLPGLPLVIAGSNGHVAWGFTNAQADVLDLVALTLHPDDPTRYRVGDRWKRFHTITESIPVRDRKDHEITISWSDWGPVQPDKLAGRTVALQWSLHYPEAVDLKLLYMDRVRHIDAGLHLFQNAGMPVLNVILADRRGNIAWTLSGKIPKRVGFRGAVSRPRDDQTYWAGFYAPASYPEIINPHSGFLITANNRVLADQEGFQYGQNFAESYRAYRIKQRLQEPGQHKLEHMHAIQLDTRTEFYEFYRQLALAALTDRLTNSQPALEDLRVAIQNWDGKAQASSTGFGYLVDFRKQLADRVFSAYLDACRELEPGFRYSWFKMDTPLRLLLTHQIPDTLPGGGATYQSWNELILMALQQVASNTVQRFPGEKIADLTWGDMAKLRLQHPFSQAVPWVAPLLDMPEQPLTGCRQCVRVAAENFGASMRMVVSPGREQSMILSQPTGQSGIPFSPNYRDKFPHWVQGQAQPGSEETSKMLRLKPKSGQ